MSNTFEHQLERLPPVLRIIREKGGRSEELLQSKIKKSGKSLVQQMSRVKSPCTRANRGLGRDQVDSQ